MAMRRIVLPVLFVLAVLTCAEPEVPPALRSETAAVTALRLDGFLADGRAVDLFLYSRGGIPFNGYALVVGKPPVPFRIVPEPPGPHGLFEAATGAEISYFPSLFRRYGYKQEDFLAMMKRYRAKEVVAKRWDDPAPIRQSADGSLSGTVDLLIPESGEAENTVTHSMYRVVVDGRPGADGGCAGRWQAWSYTVADQTYGKTATRHEGVLTGRTVGDFWQPKPGTEFAAGRDWPQTHGPYLDMSAVDCGAPLVDDLRQARLAWVGEDLMGGSKGDINKVDFGVGPLTPNDLAGGGYSAPVVAGGKVYVYAIFPDLAAIAADPAWTDHILRIRGAPLGNASFGRYLDMFLCIDARSGRTLWRAMQPVTSKNMPDEKQGRGLTPCVIDGLVIGRGLRGLYALDAATGDERWFKAGQPWAMGGGGGYWSHDESPVAIGGTVILGLGDDHCTTLVGLDPKTGSERWRKSRVKGYNSIPSQVTLAGRDYLVSACSADDRSPPTSADERLVLIDPVDGRIVWEDRRIGSCANGLAVEGDVVAGNWMQVEPSGGSATAGGTASKRFDEAHRVGAWRVSLAGAEPLWRSADVHYMPFRTTPLAHRGRFFFDSNHGQLGAFAVLDAATGAPASRAKSIYAISGGDHNWTWCAATDGRVVTSGLLMFAAAPELQQLGGQLPVPLASGYWCPVKPAIADGRLFIRSKYHLLCYDLRR